MGDPGRPGRMGDPGRPGRMGDPGRPAPRTATYHGFWSREPGRNGRDHDQIPWYVGDEPASVLLQWCLGAGWVLWVALRLGW